MLLILVHCTYLFDYSGLYILYINTVSSTGAITYSESQSFSKEAARQNDPVQVNFNCE